MLFDEKIVKSLNRFMDYQIACQSKSDWRENSRLMNTLFKGNVARD